MNYDYLSEITEQKYDLKTIQKEHIAGKKEKFVFFWGHRQTKDGGVTKSCFSQWFMSDFEVGGIKFICMEQFMMAAKAKLFGDVKIYNEIMKSRDPKTIKSLGRKVKNFKEDIWDEHKYTMVYYGNLNKFSQNGKLKNFLLSTTGKILAEASPYDSIWGIRMAENDENAEDPTKWRGKNLLGFALMQVRDEIGGM